MIRTAWFLFVATLATLYYGAIVFAASIVRHRGGVYSWVGRRWSATLLWASGCTLRVHGLERVDWSRPQVVVCNHTGSFEILALAVTIPVPSHFVAKKELERVPIFGPAWKMAGHISIDRGNREQAIASLQHAAGIIDRDRGVVVIFPEGTRSRRGELQPFKKGAFMLAIEAGVPILPTIVLGSDRVTPPGAMRVTAGPLDLYYGEPIPSEGYGPDRAEELMLVVRERMQAMIDGNLPAADRA